MSEEPFHSSVDRLFVTDSLSQRVRAWLRKYHEGAQFEITGVESITPFGDDYAGPDADTPTFWVDLRFTTTDPNRSTLYLRVDGQDMESLWRHVVGGEA